MQQLEAARKEHEATLQAQKDLQDLLNAQNAKLQRFEQMELEESKCDKPVSVSPAYLEEELAKRIRDQEQIWKGCCLSSASSLPLALASKSCTDCLSFFLKKRQV